MATTRERLQTLLDALPDDQVETVLHFAEAVQRGRAVVSVCEIDDVREVKDEATR